MFKPKRLSHLLIRHGPLPAAFDGWILLSIVLLEMRLIAAPLFWQ